ncbi:MAG: hypothetical protein A4E38_01123 [Methanoregulaceae archaeon PtaB.Bin108]|nr:MAG: hypothetical protein A4E38_01123 [Methanoregulaceae archaeon PtaB.Bin108]OPY46689.1 MAG: hypothetical protein A4E42_00428 [Methanoregulaceae archaeon PtaU1.Bin222]
MKEPLYEKDLTTMKYDILVSQRHDRMVREIAADLGVPQLKVRRYIMDHFDMILMENLPARYEQGKRVQEEAPEPERYLGAYLYTHAVPLIGEDCMDEIISGVKEMIRGGTSMDQAVLSGKSRLREAIAP